MNWDESTKRERKRKENKPTLHSKTKSFLIPLPLGRGAPPFHSSTLFIDCFISLAAPIPLLNQFKESLIHSIPFHSSFGGRPPTLSFLLLSFFQSFIVVGYGRRTAFSRKKEGKLMNLKEKRQMGCLLAGCKDSWRQRSWSEECDTLIVTMTTLG